MDYGSELRPGGKDKTGSFEAGEIWMGFGSRIVFDVMGDGSADHLKTSVLKIEKKDWQNGPKYSAPVFEVKTTGMLEGKYLLVEAGQIEGSLDDIVLEGVDGLKASLIQEDGKIYLNVDPMRAAASVVWNGGEDGIWDLANTENFLLADGKKDFFVTGDVVTFGDDATLEVNASFAEAVIKLPQCVRAELSTNGAFSGKGIEGAPAADAPYVLRIKAAVSFGNLEIVY